MHTFITYKEDQEYEPILHQKINKNSIWLSDRGWNRNNMNEVCKTIKQWNAEHFYLSYNTNKNILKEMSSISFPNLRKIVLSSNGIQSLESFNQIWVPSLSELDISKNNLVSIKEMKKCYWKTVRILVLTKNSIKSLDAVSELFSKKFKKLVVEEENCKEQCADIRPLFKVRSSRFQRIYIKSEGRISQRECLLMLAKRYDDISI